MNKFYAVAMSAIMAITMVVQTPSQAQAGNKEKALVAGLAAGAVVAAAVLMSRAKGSKTGGFSKRKFYANDACGPGYFMKNGKCRVRGGDFKVSQFGGGKSKKFSGGNFAGGKKFSGGNFKLSQVSNKPKFTSWQMQAIRKGCKPGLAWSKFEGCHEND